MRYTNKQKLWIRRIVRSLFVLYIIIMAYFLFFNESMNRTSGVYGYNLVPFKEIKRGFWCLSHGMADYFFLNIVMNVAAFIPFGFILPIISPKNKNLLNVAFLSLELTLVIEILQIVLRAGRFDVDDILMNTIGGILGYVLFQIGRTYHGRGYSEQTISKNSKKETEKL